MDLKTISLAVFVFSLTTVSWGTTNNNTDPFSTDSTYYVPPHFNVSQRPPPNVPHETPNIPIFEGPLSCPVEACPLQCARSKKSTICTEMFTSSNTLNEQAVRGLFENESQMTKAIQIYHRLQSSNVLDEKKLSCKDLKIFLKNIGRVNPQAVDNLELITSGSIQSDPINTIASIPEFFFNYIKILEVIFEKLKSVCCDEEQKECMCRLSFRLDCINRVRVQNIACNSTILCDNPGLAKCHRVKVRDEQISKYCLQYKESSKPVSSWSADDWNKTLTSHLDSVLHDKKALQYVPMDSLLASMEQHSCQKLSRFSKNVVKQKLTSMMKNKAFTSQAAHIKNSVIKTYGECGGSYKKMEKYITDKSLLVSTFNASAITNTRQMIEMRKSLAALKPSISNYTKDDIVRYIKLLVNKKHQLRQITSSVLESALPEISQMKFNPGQLRNLYSQVKTIPRFSMPSTFTMADILALGNLLSVIPPQQLDVLPSSALGGALATGQLQSVPWFRGAAQKIYYKYKQFLNKESTGTVTADELLKLGDLSIHLRRSDWKSISPEEIFSFMNNSETIERTHRLSKYVTKAVENTIVQKVSAIQGGLDVLSKYDGFRKVAGRMSKNDISNIATKLRNGEVLDVSFTKTQCRRTLSKMKENIGPVETWSAETFETLKSSKLIGCMSPADIELTIQNNPNGLQVMSYVGASARSNENLKEKMVKSVRSQLENASSETINTMKEQLIENPQVLVRLKEDILNKLSCEDIISSLQSIDLLTVPCTRLSDKMNFFLKCKNITENMEITDTVLEDAGSILCASRPEHIKRMTAQALTYYSPDLAKCQCQSLENKETKHKALQDKQVIPSSPSQYTEEHLAILGDDVLAMKESFIIDTPNSALEPYISTLLENLSKLDQDMKERRKKGFRNDRDASERAVLQSRVKAFKKRAIEIILSSSSSRRRRSLSGLSCTVMQSLQSALTELTVNDISAIEVAEFSSCADLLGSDMGFSAQQISALANKAKEAWGSQTSLWTENNIHSAGRILQGLSSVELGNLRLNLDHIYSMGAYEKWTSDQKEKLFTKFLSLANYPDPSSMTSLEMSSLGHVLCGIQASDIALLNVSNYGNVAESIGELTTCSNEQLEAFASLAKSFFGSDVSVWDDAAVSAVGIVIGGLPANDIAKLTETHISAIDAGDVAYIPAKQFASFTIVQIGYFSTAQAQAITMDQYNALNEQQKAVIEFKAEMKFGSDPKPTSGTNQIFQLPSIYFLYTVPMVLSLFF